MASVMCRHSQQAAVARGIRAMQINLVVSTNKSAIRIWKRHDELEVILNSSFERYGDRLIGCYKDEFLTVDITSFRVVGIGIPF